MKQASQVRAERQAAWVWIIASIVMFSYSLLVLLAFDIPGMAQIIDIISSIQTSYIVAAAFVVIFIEGIYGIGSLFPGSSFTLLFASLAALESPATFALVVISIFLGWSSATVINILYAKRMYPTTITQSHQGRSHILYSWMPGFRANQEVADIARGISVYRVVYSTLVIKLIASIIVGGIAYMLPFIMDIETLSVTNGFVLSVIFAAITLGIGLFKLSRITLDYN